MLKKIEKESLIITDDKIEVFLKTVTCMEDKKIFKHQDFIKKMLLEIFNNKYSSEDRNLVDKLRKAICRLDETLYSNNQ